MLPYYQGQMYIRAYQSLVFNQMASYRFKTFGSDIVSGDLVELDDGAVKILSKEDIVNLSSDDKSVLRFQIVLPLPGSQSIYPENEVGKMYQHQLQKDRIDSFPPTVKGSYRRFLQRPTGESVVSAASDAVAVEFSLPTGAFATVCLRELMKMNL